MYIRVFKNKEELYKEAANFFIDAVKENPSIVLGLATGSTPIGLYENLVSDYKENKTNYSKVVTFNLDEYIDLPKSHYESYYSFMHRNLFDFINIKPENIHLPNGVGSNHLGSCDEYNKLLSKTKVDIQLLGIGANGHIGFNEPGTLFDSLTHIVELTNKTREDNARFFDSIDEVPKEAITMGIKTILEAKKVFLIATGANKADAVYQMAKCDMSINCPASALQQHNDCYIFVDEAAAAKLNLK